jgi:hypothetical protein
MIEEERILTSLRDGAQLRRLLVATKGETSFQIFQLPETVKDQAFLHTLESAQLLHKDADSWTFQGYGKIRVAIRALQLGEPNRSILTALSWQEFEEFTAQVLAFHNFQVCHRFRFSDTRRYEIDILAGRRPVLFCIDCKQYGVRLNKASSLRTAADEQLHRTRALADTFAQFQAKIGCLDWPNPVLIPMVVTMLIEDIQFHEKIPIVPASLLNGFLLKYEERLDSLCILEPGSGRQLRLI